MFVSQSLSGEIQQVFFFFGNVVRLLLAFSYLRFEYTYMYGCGRDLRRCTTQTHTLHFLSTLSLLLTQDTLKRSFFRSLFLLLLRVKEKERKCMCVCKRDDVVDGDNC